LASSDDRTRELAVAASSEVLGASPDAGGASKM
jgi:hypothetical protein